MNDETIKSRVLAFTIIAVYLICIFLIKDKMTVDSITYLKYLH